MQSTKTEGGVDLVMFGIAVLTAGLFFSGAESLAQPLFPGAQYPARYGPMSVAIGDLDGDQVPDLAVAKSGDEANGYEGCVSVLLGIGDGTFASAVHYAAGDGPRSIAIGDLDADLAPDLVLANADSDNVSVLLNQQRPCRGDLNCDGLIDFGDINPFVLMLSNWPGWLARYPDCPGWNADINGDGQ